MATFLHEQTNYEIINKNEFKEGKIVSVDADTCLSMRVRLKSEEKACWKASPLHSGHSWPVRKNRITKYINK